MSKRPKSSTGACAAAPNSVGRPGRPQERRPRTALAAIALLTSALLASTAGARVLEQEGPCTTDVQTDAPRDISVLNDGGTNFLAVADSGNDRVYVGYGSPSNCIWRIGTTGTGDGQLDDPAGVVLDSEGYVYVADTGNGRIQKFDTYMGKATTDPLGFELVFDSVSGSGSFGLSAPEGLGTYLDDGLDQIYVADTGNRRIVVFGASGTFIQAFGEEDADGDLETFEGGTFFDPADVAVCGGNGPHPGRIYVLDRGAGLVQAFSPLDDGPSFLYAFGRPGDQLGELDAPSSIGLDINCNVYVADTGNDRVQIFTPEGRFLEQLDAASEPTGVAVGNRLFVSKEGSDSVARYEYIDWDTNGDGNIDDDGDDLPDLWEEEGIDFDGDGTADFLLPGADPRHKDVYVEVDFAGGEEPVPVPGRPDLADNLELVERAFDDAPVSNPDGSTGIHLHLERGDSIAGLAGKGIVFDVSPPLPAGLTTFPLYFPKIKSDYFGSPAQRIAPNAVNLLAAKELVYHYAVWGFGLCSTVPLPITPTSQCTALFPNSGSSEVGGNDFLLALQTITKPVTRAGTFMHELGHNFGMDHGGRVDGHPDGANCKPNYLSVMNYEFQAGIPNDTPTLGVRIDYSREELPVLDENDLDEHAGVGAAPVGPGGAETDRTAWSPDGVNILQQRADLPIDWDNDGALETGLVFDVNAFPIVGCGKNNPTPGDMLRGAEDWGQLIYNNRRVAFRSADGSPLGGTSDEISVDDLALLPELLNRPPDCSAAFLSTDELWPPNHAFHDISVAGVTDPDGDDVTIAVTSVFQDEPLLTGGAGASCPDATGLGTDTVSVRAERSGGRGAPGDGRVYHVGVTATDEHGATCEAVLPVCVPHDQRPGHACVDQGALFDSTGAGGCS